MLPFLQRNFYRSTINSTVASFATTAALGTVVLASINFPALAAPLNPNNYSSLGALNLSAGNYTLFTKETLENPTTLRENGRVIAGVDRLHGRQAVRFW
jgi:hypothetical protein